MSDTSAAQIAAIRVQDSAEKFKVRTVRAEGCFIFVGRGVGGRRKKGKRRGVLSPSYS